MQKWSQSARKRENLRIDSKPSSMKTKRTRRVAGCVLSVIAIGKVAENEWITGQQILRVNAAHFSEESQAFLLGDEVMLVFIFENIVEGHQPRTDHAVALPSAILRVGVAEEPVDRLGEEMIDVESLAVVDGFDMPGIVGLFEKASGEKAFVPVDEVVELAAQKVAGVGRDKIQERGLAFRVAERFKSGERDRQSWLKLQNVFHQVVIALDLRGQGRTVGGRSIDVKSGLRFGAEMAGAIRGGEDFDVLMAAA